MTPPERRRLLVPGGSGFLGAHVVRAAHAAGWRVVVGSRSPDALHGIPGTEEVEHAAFDGREAASVEDLIERAAPQAIVVCTALPGIADCERDPALARALNCDLPAALARASAVRGLRLVHVSTDLVFAGAPPRPTGYREDDAVGPRSEYGRTKAAGEDLVLAADPAAVVVRLPLLFGESFERAQGASDAIVAAVRRGEAPALFTDEWRTPLDAARAGRALVALAGRAESGLLHVAGEERLTRLDLGLRALAAAGFADPRALVRAATRAEKGHGDRPADVALDASRARAFLAW